jgi:tetratricopeptide (TPR) repeat protein
VHLQQNNKQHITTHSSTNVGDSDTVRSLIARAVSLRHSNPRQAMELSEQALALSKKLGYEVGTASALAQKAVCHFHFGEYDTCFQLAHEALERFTSLSDNFGKAYSLKVIACVHAVLGQETKALEQFLSGLSLLTQAPELHLLGDKNSEMGTMLMNIGAAYMNIPDYEQSLSYYLKSFDYHAKTNNLGGMAECASNLGALYIHLKKLEDAIQWLERSIDYSKAIRKSNSHIVALINLCEVYLEMGNLDKASQLLQESIRLSEDSGDMRYAHVAYQSLSRIYEQLGDYKEALLCYKKYVELYEQFYGKQMEQKIKSLEIQFAVKEAEKNAQLSAQNEKIKQLEEMVTICAWSGKIKMGEKWVRVEEFLQKKFGFKVTHGITEEVAEKLRKEYNLGKPL